MTTTEAILERYRPHRDMGLAKLRLRGRYGVDELDDAELELHRKGYVKQCTMPGHREDCVRVTRKGVA